MVLKQVTLPLMVLIWGVTSSIAFAERLEQGTADTGAGLNSDWFVDELPVAAGNEARDPDFRGIGIRGGKVETIYLDANGHVAYRGQGLEQRVDAETRKPGGGYFSLKVAPETTLLSWWRKQDEAGKHLYVSRVFELESDGVVSTEVGPAVKINSADGVLPEAQVASNDRGWFAVAYHDERVARYGIFLNVSTDRGESWLAEDMRVDTPGSRAATVAIEPKVVFVDDSVVVAWRDDGVENGDGTRYMVRVLDVPTLTWAEPVELARFEQGFFTGDVLVEADGTLLLLGTQLWDRTGLVGYLSSDGGETWQAIDALPESKDWIEISWLSVTSHEGVASVAFVWQPEGRDEARRPLKYRVGFANLDLEHGTWLGEHQRLDTESWPDITTSSNPTLIATESGALVAAWEDRREIRVNVYLSRSLDGGETWSAPVAMAPALQSTRDHPKLFVEGKEVFLGYYEVVGGEVPSASWKVVALGPDAQRIEKLTAPGFMLSDDERLARLEERVDAFWHARAEGNFAAAYDFLDPAYRGVVSRDGYERTQGRLQFEDYEIVAVQVTGRFGGSLTKMTAAIPQARVGGSEFELEPREDDVPHEWVWIDGDWFVVMGRAGSSGRVLMY